MPVSATATQSRCYRYPFARERTLNHAIIAGRRADAVQALDQLFNTLRENSPTLRQLKSDAIHLTVALIRKSFRSGVPVDEMMESVLHHCGRIIQVNSISELHSILHGNVDSLLKVVGQQRLRDPQQTIRKAVQYIQTHCNRGLSLEDVAEVVGLSYSYLSRLFSQETGRSFQEYVTHFRHQLARQLLLTTDLTVEQIATQVGYEDASHFIRVFKRCSGMTPRRFAQTHGSQALPAAELSDYMPLQT